MDKMVVEIEEKIEQVDPSSYQIVVLVLEYVGIVVQVENGDAFQEKREGNVDEKEMVMKHLVVTLQVELVVDEI